MNQTDASPGPEATSARVLLVADPGVSSELVESGLRARGYDVARFGTAEPDLSSNALGYRAIVFLPSARWLQEPADVPFDRERIAEVLRASSAPGVELLVAALPVAKPFDAVVDAIERHGRPFIVVRSPGLLEEVAQALTNGQGTLWLPSTGEVVVGRGSALVEALDSALTSDDQGRVLQLASERFDVAGLVAAASSLAGTPVRVRRVAPLVYRTVRPIARWLRGGEPASLALVDQLLAQTAPGMPRRPHVG